MKKLLASVAIALLVVTMLISSCNKPDTGLQPYEYTGTDEIKQIEYYETERIRDAEKTPVMTLEQLGYSDLELAGGEEAASPAIAYTLPDDATQGPDIWYAYDFHFLIEFEEDTGGGFCDVKASPLGSVPFDVQKVNDAPFIRVGGQSVTSTSVAVHYYNYMGINDVKPGENELIFKYKEYEGVKIKKVTVYKDTAIFTTGTAPSEYDEGQKITAAEQAKAQEIAFKDTRVQAMIEGKAYALRVTKSSDMVRPVDEPPDDDIEVRLVFKEIYLIDGIEASALDIFIDLNEEAVTYLFPLGDSGMPELTATEKDRAVKIALGDAAVEGLLGGKGYEITRIGISQGGPVGRMGANMDIVFDQIYPFTGDFPYFPAEKKYLDQSLKGIEVFVNLKDGAVVQIWPEIVMEP